MAQQEGNINSQAYRIGSMTGGKAIAATPITINDMYQRGNGIIKICRTQASHIGTNQRCTHLVSEDDN